MHTCSESLSITSEFPPQGREDGGSVSLYSPLEHSLYRRTILLSAEIFGVQAALENRICLKASLAVTTLSDGREPWHPNPHPWHNIAHKCCPGRAWGQSHLWAHVQTESPVWYLEYLEYYISVVEFSQLRPTCRWAQGKGTGAGDGSLGSSERNTSKTQQETFHLL